MCFPAGFQLEMCSVGLKLAAGRALGVYDNSSRLSFEVARSPNIFWWADLFTQSVWGKKVFICIMRCSLLGCWRGTAMAVKIIVLTGHRSVCLVLSNIVFVFITFYFYFGRLMWGKLYFFFPSVESLSPTLQRFSPFPKCARTTPRIQFCCTACWVDISLSPSSI